MVRARVDVGRNKRDGPMEERERYHMRSRFGKHRGCKMSVYRTLSGSETTTASFYRWSLQTGCQAAGRGHDQQITSL